MLRTLLKTFGLLLVCTTVAAAQDYPTKPVRLIIPFAPGGSVDIVARLVASRLSDRLGQQVTPDNRAGAGGIIGAEIASKAPADGYTLLLVSLAHTVNPHIYKVGYDTQRSFSLVAMLGNGPSVLTVNPSVPANTVKELIALAKSKPRDYAFAHAGIGSFTHTASVLFAMMADIEVEQIPFKGGGPAMIDVMGGHSHLLMNSYLASVPHIRSGKLKALGVSDTRRTHLLPDVPTIAEVRSAGLSGGELVGHRRSRRDAAAGHRQAACGHRRGAGFRRREEPVRQGRRVYRADEPCRVLEILRGRIREVGQGGEGSEDQAGIRLALQARRRNLEPLVRR